jgi:hypothetical protein
VAAVSEEVGVQPRQRRAAVSLDIASSRRGTCSIVCAIVSSNVVTASSGVSIAASWLAQLHASELYCGNTVVGLLVVRSEARVIHRDTFGPSHR